MKKLVLLSVVLLSLGVLTACGGEEETAATTKETTNQIEKKEENKETIEVEKNLLSVEVTLPPSMFEGQDINEVISEAKADGVKEVTKNEDGSLTYKMDKSTHKKIMDEAEKGILDYVDQVKNSEDFVSIHDIKHNKDFSEFTIIVDQAKYENSLDGFAALGFAMTGLYYQLFDGVDPEDYEVTLSFENKDTGEVFESIVYPDAFEQ